MNTYKEMYYQLFNNVTDIIFELQRAQQETEELFLSHEDPPEKAQSKET